MNKNIKVHVFLNNIFFIEKQSLSQEAENKSRENG